MNALELAYKIGEDLACIGRNTAVKSSAIVQATLVDNEPFDRWVLRIGEVAFKEAGCMEHLGYQLCKTAADAPVWTPQFAEIADIVTAAIGREFEYQKAASMDSGFDVMTPDEEKRAGLGWLSTLLAGGVSNAPAIGQLIAGGALLAGGAGGSLAWMANRSVSEDDDDIEAMKAKIKTYRRLTEDIQNEINLRDHPAGIPA
jgi:hypothetical protein